MNMHKKNESLYLVLISVHGLIRSRDLELGCDANTGGQTKYVVELAKALAKQPEVERVDLVTRRIIDSEVTHDYAEVIEPLVDNAQIVRITAGPEGYIRKEELWDYLDNFTDNLLGSGSTISPACRISYIPIKLAAPHALASLGTAANYSSG